MNKIAQLARLHSLAYSCIASLVCTHNLDDFLSNLMKGFKCDDMANIIIGIIIALAVGLAIGYIIKSKRNGSKCIGCPYSDSCDKHCK